MEFLLKNASNIESVNEELHSRLELEVNVDKFVNYDITKVINETDVFDNERQNSEIYRIHGSFEYMSLLNNMRISNSYNIADYFDLNKKNGDRDIYNSFDFYLVRPTNELHSIQYNGKTCYVRRFEIIATPDNIEIMNAGFSKNIFNEQKYMFIINKDIDVSNYSDIFNIPITELFLYPVFKKNDLSNEELKFKNWNTNGNSSFNDLNNIDFNVGDRVVGDVIYFNKNTFSMEKMVEQTYEITTFYSDKTIKWNYKPFIPLKLRYYSSILSKTSSRTSSYEELQTIPSYALKMDGSDTFVWRDIIPQGNIDPLSGEGVDYPFNNNSRYLFDSIILSIVPDMTHSQTYSLFKEIWYEINSSIKNTKPLTDLNNIGKPCL